MLAIDECTGGFGGLLAYVLTKNNCPKKKCDQEVMLMHAVMDFAIWNKGALVPVGKGDIGYYI